MTKKACCYYNIGVFLLLWLIAPSSCLIGQQHPPPQEMEKITQWIEQLNHSDWRIRDKAVSHLNRLKKEQKTERVRKALINLLEREVTAERDGKKYITTVIPDPGQGKGEGFGEYIVNLLEAVANLRDARAVPILVEFMAGGGQAVEDALVEIGERCVDPLIEKLHKGAAGLNLSLKAAAAKVLGRILKEKKTGYTAKGKIRVRIKQALFKALKENQHPTDASLEWYEMRVMERAWVRKNIVWALGESGDKDVIPVLEEISRTDPYKKKRKDGTIYHPVREEARKAVAKIQSLQ